MAADPLFVRQLPTIKAILFDVDGTLIATNDQAITSLANRLSFLGQTAVPTARRLLTLSETPGNALVTLLIRLRLETRLVAITDVLRRWRGVHDEASFRLTPDLAHALPRLAQTYTLGIVTTRSRYHIDAFLRKFPDLQPLFTISVGLQDTRRLKPHPEPILTAASQLNLPPDRCLMVGDTPNDMHAARRAGAWRVGVLCGFGEAAELRAAGANAVLTKTADLPAFLAQHL